MHEVVVLLIDGTEERYQTPNNIGLPGPVLMIDQGNGCHVAIPIAHIRKWEFKASKLSMAGAVPGPHLRPVQ